MPAIHEHHQLDGFRTPKFDERIERRAGRGSRIEDVVTEQNAAIVYRKGNVGPPYDRLRPDGMAHEVVAIERDVERARRHFLASDVPDDRGEPAGHGDTATPDA